MIHRFKGNRFGDSWCGGGQRAIMAPPNAGPATQPCRYRTMMIKPHRKFP